MQIQLAMRHDRNGTLWISRNKKQYSTLDTIKPARYFIPRGSAPQDEKMAGFMVSGRNYYTIGGQYRGGDKEGTIGETANGQTEQNRSEVGDRPPKRRGTKVQGSELFKRSEIGSIDPI
jgi:hypothetical protein